jgi:hypothetical protein
MAATSIAPSAAQQMALPRSSAIQYPVAALKQRTALVHPLAQAAGLLSIFRNFIAISKSPDSFYLNTVQKDLCRPELLDRSRFFAESNLHRRSSMQHEPG